MNPRVNSWRYAAMKATIDRAYGTGTAERRVAPGYLQFASDASDLYWRNASK
jgi:hypothetical protein